MNPHSCHCCCRNQMHHIHQQDIEMIKVDAHGEAGINAEALVEHAECKEEHQELCDMSVCMMRMYIQHVVHPASKKAP